MSQRRQVVILAGGLGTRLRPITEKIPKPMVPVAGMPFLHWQLEDLRLQGYHRVLLLVAYLGEQVETYFGDGRSRGMQLSYSYEPEPLGTGGALKLAMAKLDDSFLLLNGDSFLRAPLSEFQAKFAASGQAAMVSVYDNHDAVPVIPNIKVKGDRVVGYQKDAGRENGYEMIDSGIYFMKRELLANYPEQRFMLADLWPPLIAEGKLGAFIVNERFWDIGTPERLKEFEEKVRDYFPNPTAH